MGRISPRDPAVFREFLCGLAVLLGLGLAYGAGSPEGAPAGVTAGEWSSMRAQMAAARYQLSWQVRDGQWAWRASNPAQGFVLAFAQDGFEARGTAGVEETPWTFDLSLHACNGATFPPAPLELTAGRVEATYRWSDTVAERYGNTPRGVEHGLSVAAAPPGGEELLELAFDLDTTLTPVPAADRQGFGLRDWRGEEILRYDRLAVSDAAGRAVPAWVELDGEGAFRLVAVTAGMEYPLTIDSLLHLPAATLHASDAQANDYSGYSVAISGDTVVVGAYGEDGGASDPLQNSGAAYVFTRNRGSADGWGEVRILRASDAQTGDWFGYSVAISGDTVVVGARMEDGGAGNPLQDSGAAYVFARNQGGADNWGQVQKLQAGDAQASDNFGWSVAISGDTAVVGAVSEAGGAGDPLPGAGAAYVFARNQWGADNWGEVKILRASDAQAFDYFGLSVAISGDTAVVGAVSEAGGGGDPLPGAGAAYVFARNQGGADSWGQIQKLQAGDAQADDWFGLSVAISGDTVVVGAYREAGGGGDPLPRAGAAYVFARNQGGADSWGQVQKLQAGDAQADDYSGSSVAISGDTVVVSAFGEAGGAGDPMPFAGAAYVFARNQGGADSWGQVQKLQAGDAQAADQFGSSVAISGDTVVVGARMEDGGAGDPQSDAGAAYVFTQDEGEWKETVIRHNSEAQTGDLFGYSLSIAGDTVVVGAPLEDGGAGDPFVESGAAYVFSRNQDGADGWGEVKILRASDAQATDQFGWSVAISGDTVVVGALYEDGGAGDPLLNAGAAYVFVRNQGSADNWGEVKVLQASDVQEGDLFGWSVAISGDTVVVGATGEDGGVGDPLPSAGAAYVFARNQGGADNWGQVQKLQAGDAQAHDRFGFSVATSGDTAVVGAISENGGAGDPLPSAGAAYVFVRNQGGADNWGQVQKIQAGDAQVQDQFGSSVAISGDTVVVGTPVEDGGAGDPLPDAGAAYVFTRNQGGADNWGQVQMLQAGDAQAGDGFGFSVATSGDMVMVGAVGEDGGVGNPLSGAGAAYLFVRNQGGADNWGQVQMLQASDASVEDVFGWAVAISEDTVVVGAPGEDGGAGDPLPNAGAIYFFQLQSCILLDCTATATPDYGPAPLGVTFAGGVTTVGCDGEIPAWAWDFGDGATSADQNPTHSYANGGTYSWSMTVTVGTLSCTQTGTVTVCEITGCTATATPDYGPAPLGVTFAGGVTTVGCDGEIPAWAWDFGDGATSADQNPTHSYANGGTCSWSMTVTVGTLSCTQTGTVTVCEIACSGGPDVSGGVVPMEVNFHSDVTVTGCIDPVTYLWDFGNGETSTGANPSVTYLAGGTYTWTLTVSSGAETCVLTGTIVADPFDLHFLDDAGRSRLCVNSRTGAFHWQVLAGSGPGIYPGMCLISTTGGLINYASQRGLPYELRFRYQPATGRADGVFTVPALRLQSGLDDRNVADNPPGCD